MLAAALVAAFLCTAARAAPPPVVRMGVVVDGPWSGNDAAEAMFQEEILALAEGEFDVRFEPDKTIVSDWTVAGVRAALDRLLADGDVDMVLALGVLASNDACRRRDLPKPVIAPVVIDADVQHLPAQNGTSGVGNLNYIVCPENVRRDIEAFLEIVNFDSIVVLLNAPVAEAIPDVSTGFDEALRGLGVRVTVLPVAETIDGVLENFPAGVDAVYIAPLLQLRASEFDRLVSELIERRLPSFSMFGDTDVERGILASVNHEFLPHLSRRVALNVQRILLGEGAGTLPTAFSIPEQLTINMATARAIRVYPPWAVLTDAVLINDVRRDIERRIDLEGVAMEALAANLELAVRERSLAVGAEDVNAARAALLPQIDLSMSGVQIDEDRAEKSLGQQAERTLTGSVSLNQIVFSEPALANRAVQRHMQNSREYERDVLTLDIVQSATTAYLNLLKAKTSERIQKENLARTRSNLALARTREALGSARAAEVLRWESELANNRKAVIEANSQRNIAEIALNRLLHRPAEEPFATEETDLDDPALLLGRERLTKYMSNPWDFRVFRRFMVEEGLRSSPEVKALDEAIAARRRAARSAGRAFWVPRVGMFARLDNVFARDGAGSSPPSGLPPQLSGAFRAPEDLSWQVGVSLTYPLFQGGAKFHERSQALAASAELELELASVSEQIEQRIRSALHLTGASYAGMAQAQLAADAASESFELVADAYSKGAATIVDVLDAQNNARVAQDLAAGAVYDFMIDMIRVERSVGRLVVQMSQAERDEFYDRLDAFFEQNQNP